MYTDWDNFNGESNVLFVLFQVDIDTTVALNNVFIGVLSSGVFQVDNIV